MSGTEIQAGKCCPICDKKLYYTVKTYFLGREVYKDFSMLRSLRFVDEKQFSTARCQEIEFCNECTYERTVRIIQRSAFVLGTG